jgi:hypothetical protein
LGSSHFVALQILLVVASARATPHWVSFDGGIDRPQYVVAGLCWIELPLDS